jgi:glycosyltransferase involved in cell wall biosynthesis
MHIGIDARLTSYRTGGISTYMRRLVAALETLDTQNRYTVFQSRKASRRLSQRFNTASLLTPCHHRFERLALSLELARFRLDVLHSPDFIPPYRGARSHVITIHDLTFMHYPQFITDDARRYYNGQIKQAVKAADHILVDSEATRRDLMHMLNVPAEKITAHRLGVDERFKPLPPEALAASKAQLKLPETYILFVGTFEPRKNILGLLRAYQHLISNSPDTPPVLLVGRQGWRFQETMQQITELKLGSRVIWREDIGDDDLPVVYNLAQVLVAPSFYEGFGFPALEAMACGTVPIVSNRSSLPEVVGEVGVQVEPEDIHALAAAMEQALYNTHWRETHRAAGLARAKQFTWEHTATIALSVYERVGT